MDYQDFFAILCIAIMIVVDPLQNLDSKMIRIILYAFIVVTPLMFKKFDLIWSLEVTCKACALHRREQLQTSGIQTSNYTSNNPRAYHITHYYTKRFHAFIRIIHMLIINAAVSL